MSTFILTTPIPITEDNSFSTGDGPSTIYQLGATPMPTNCGMIDVKASGVSISNLMLDGNCLTSTDVARSSITDPDQASFVLNAMVWAHGPLTNLTISNITIQHAPSYGIVLDCRAGTIDTVIMKNCQFVNNRGSTFDGGGGSWLGPIFWKNLGMTNTFSLKNLIVKNCTLSRNTGNCIWGHQNAFNTMSTNITMSGCSFENCGLDGIEIGGAENVSISNSVFHRQGVVAVDDTSDPLPVYVPGAGACCIDTTSNVTQATYTNCSMTSLTGCGVDLDGLWNGVISNMTISQPLSTDPLYTLDHIGVCGPSGAANAAYGIQTGNTYPPLGGQDVVITNNVISNMGTRAISLQNARKCKVSLNHVWHSGSASEQPVILFPVDKSETNGGTVGLAGQNACWGCKVENNTMIYGSDTPASAFCVAEVKHRNGLDGGECQQGNPTPILSEQTNQTLTAPSGQTVTVPFAPLQRTVPTPSDNWDAGVHVDYHLSNNMQLMGKFYDQQHTAPYAGGGTSGYFYGTPSHSKQAGGSWVWTINPTTVNEFRFSFIKSEYYDCGGNTYNFTELTQNVASVGIRAFRVMGWPTIFRNTGSSTATSIRTA